MSTFPLGLSPATAVRMPGAEAFALNCGAYGSTDGTSPDCVFVRCVGHYRMHETLRLVYPSGGQVLPLGVEVTCGAVDLGPWTTAPLMNATATWPSLVICDTSAFTSLASRALAALRRALVRVLPSLGRAISAEAGRKPVKPTIPRWYIPVVVVLAALAVAVGIVDVLLGVLRYHRRARAARRRAAALSGPCGAEGEEAEKLTVPVPPTTARTGTTSATASPPVAPQVLMVPEPSLPVMRVLAAEPAYELAPPPVREAWVTPAEHCPDYEASVFVASQGSVTATPAPSEASFEEADVTDLTVSTATAPGTAPTTQRNDTSSP